MLRVLYIASNPEGPDQENSLLLEREITALERRLPLSPAEPVEFRFLPELPLEDLNSEVNRFAPTIVHISAHGSKTNLTLANAGKQGIGVDGEQLAALLHCSSPPRLVYLNACNSAAIAKAISRRLCMAIGTTAPISNRAARATAVQFYEELLRGADLEHAYQSSLALLEALEHGSVRTMLHAKDKEEPRKTVLVAVPRVIARFPVLAAGPNKGKIKSSPDKQGGYDIEYGLSGCPADTTQVVFFTDDTTFLEDDEDEELCEADSLALQLAQIARDRPIRGVVWTRCTVSAVGDYRLFAVGLTALGRLFYASANICDALTHFLAKGWYGKISAVEYRKIAMAVNALSMNDGGPPEVRGSATPGSASSKS